MEVLILQVSIIVPIYNAEKFLDKCLESIYKQHFSDFEVILIDDGSTDSSRQICQKYTSYSSKFRYFYKENSGVSDTRNFGLGMAVGMFVTFIDADDFIENNHIGNLVKNMSNSQISITGFEKSSENMNPLKVEKKILNKKCLIENILENRDVEGYLWNKMFLLDLIKKEEIKFEKEISYGEDLVFCIEYALYCNKGMYENFPTYHYVEHQESASKSLNGRRLINRMSYLDAVKRIEEILPIEYHVYLNAQKNRAAREASIGYYQGAKLNCNKKYLNQLLINASPFIKWRLIHSKKNLSWLRGNARIALNIFFGKFFLLKR